MWVWRVRVRMACVCVTCGPYLQLHGRRVDELLADLSELLAECGDELRACGVADSSDHERANRGIEGLLGGAAEAVLLPLGHRASTALHAEELGLVAGQCREGELTMLLREELGDVTLERLSYVVGGRKGAGVSGQDGARGQDGAARAEHVRFESPRWARGVARTLARRARRWASIGAEATEQELTPASNVLRASLRMAAAATPNPLTILPFAICGIHLRRVAWAAP